MLILKETVEPLAAVPMKAFQAKIDELSGSDLAEDRRMGMLKRLDPAEDRWLLLLQGAATAAALQSVAPAVASFGPHRLGIAFVPGDNVELVELDVAAQDHLGCLRHDAVAQHHGLGVALAQTQFPRDLTVR